MLFTKILRRINKVIKSRWIGEQLEVAYWKRADIPAWKLDWNHPLQEKFVDILPEKKIVYILDVGCGMLSTVGKAHKGKAIFLYGIDPLADKYVKILKERGVDRFLYPHSKSIDDFNDNAFHIVYARNSIDHAEDPLKEIKEMVRVCKGTVMMEHFINTGKNENYMGLHQWNFELRENDLWLWDRKIGYNLSVLFKRLTNEIIKEEGYTWIRTKIDCTRPTHLTMS